MTGGPPPFFHSYTNQLLWVLLRCCRSPQSSLVRSVLTKPEWINLILDLAVGTVVSLLRHLTNRPLAAL